MSRKDFNRDRFGEAPTIRTFDEVIESPFGPSYYDAEVVENRLRRQFQSEMASFESLNPPSDLDRSCDSPIPPPTDDSGDSDSYVEDIDEGAGMSNGPTNYGREESNLEKSHETFLAKDMSALLDQVRGLAMDSQDNRRQKEYKYAQETRSNGSGFSKKSVIDLAGAWMEKDSAEWRRMNS